ncbi:MAG: hypothetical protein P8Y92_14905 [Halioglobus sp.]
MALARGIVDRQLVAAELEQQLPLLVSDLPFDVEPQAAICQSPPGFDQLPAT